MKIETKYAIGEEVYVIFKEDNGSIKLFKDTITEITLSSYEKTGYLYAYYVGNMCEEFIESEIIRFDDKEGLIKTIDQLCDNDSNSK